MKYWFASLFLVFGCSGQALPVEVPSTADQSPATNPSSEVESIDGLWIVSDYIDFPDFYFRFFIRNNRIASQRFMSSHRGDPPPPGHYYFCSDPLSEVGTRWSTPEMRTLGIWLEWDGHALVGRYDDETEIQARFERCTSDCEELARPFLEGATVDCESVIE